MIYGNIEGWARGFHGLGPKPARRLLFFQKKSLCRDLHRHRSFGAADSEEVKAGSEVAFFEMQDFGANWPKLAQQEARHVAQFDVQRVGLRGVCLLYTCDAADEGLCGEFGGGLVIKRKDDR